MHLFISAKQRPLEAVPDLESKPVWSTDEDVGLTAHEEELAMFRWPTNQTVIINITQNEKCPFNSTSVRIKEEKVQLVMQFSNS